MYAAYVLTEQSKKELLKLYPPKNSKILCDHVTIEFGIPTDYKLPEDNAIIKVIGYLSVDGLDAFLVTVNGSNNRADGNKYHITSSIDPAKHQPKDTNNFITDSRLIKSIIPSIAVETTAEVKN